MKSILLYSLSGREPDKETLVVGKAVENTGHRAIIVIDKPSATIEKEFAHVFVNERWSYEYLLQQAKGFDVELALVLTDFATPLVGRLNDELNLPGPTASQYDLISNKLNWSQLMADNKMPMPKQELITTSEQFNDFDWEFPLFVKPVKSTANISFEKYGYRYFDHAREFKDFLEKENLVEHFLEGNQKPGALGPHIVQERVDPVSWNNGLATIVDGKFYFHEVHSSLFYPFPHHMNYYATYGPLDQTTSEAAHIEKIGSIFQKIGLQNTPLAFDVVTAQNGQVYTLDVNARSGGTFTILGPYRGVKYFEAVIEGILSGDFSVPKNMRPFLRHTVLVDPGVVRGVEVSASMPKTVEITGTEYFDEPIAFEGKMGRFHWPLEAVIVEDDLQACFDQYEIAKNALTVHYD